MIPTDGGQADGDGSTRLRMKISTGTDAEGYSKVYCSNEVLSTCSPENAEGILLNGINNLSLRISHVYGTTFITDNLAIAAIVLTNLPTDQNYTLRKGDEVVAEFSLDSYSSSRSGPLVVALFLLSVACSMGVAITRHKVVNKRLPVGKVRALIGACGLMLVVLVAGVGYWWGAYVSLLSFVSTGYWLWRFAEVTGAVAIVVVIALAAIITKKKLA
jgi:hypothetical protein